MPAVYRLNTSHWQIPSQIPEIIYAIADKNPKIKVSSGDDKTMVEM